MISQFPFCICRQHTSNQQKQFGPLLKKTHSIFVEDECYGKQEFDYKNDNNNRKHVPTIVTQHQQQYAFKSNEPHMHTSGEKNSSGQQSLDIPTRDDDDNKSQHSYRTIGSSRRQSTEDSIDTDDEYFCYELRKLEELEYESKMEQSKRTSRVDEELQQSLLSKIDALNTDTDTWYINNFNFVLFFKMFIITYSIFNCLLIRSV